MDNFILSCHNFSVFAFQPAWSIPVQQQVVTSVTAPTTAPVSVAPVAASATCDWTEHTSPEGHKYYYNSSTGESRVSISEVA